MWMRGNPQLEHRLLLVRGQISLANVWLRQARRAESVDEKNRIIDEISDILERVHAMVKL